MDEQAGRDHERRDRDRWALARRRMVETQLAGRGIRDPAVLAAMNLVPREAFVPPSLRAQAYDDGALSIGHGQTISQPYMVARMVEALRLTERGWPWDDERPTVLDVGLGSGYQAAVLAQLGARVIATSSSDEKLARASELGAEVAVNHATADVAKEIKAATGGHGVDVVVEHVGEATWKTSLSVAARS